MINMDKDKIITKRAYRALIKSGKYIVKELRKAGFKFNTGSESGNIFNQVEGFCMDSY
jgi:3-methyladenine DNA glycosylase Tag